MPIRTDSSRAKRDASLGELVALATRDMSLLIRQEIELAKAEMARQAVSAGLGIGFLVVAAGLAFGAIIAGTIFLGELFTWAGMERFWAYLATAVLYLVVAGLLAIFAVTRFKKLSPPERTIQSVRDDIAWLRNPAAGAAGNGLSAPTSAPPAAPTAAPAGGSAILAGDGGSTP